MIRRASLLLLLLCGLSGPALAQSPAQLAQRQPDLARDSLSALLRTALASARRDDAPAAGARAMARALAAAWSDSFLLRRTEWLLSLDRRAARRFLAADSIRRAGNERLYREGPDAALAAFDQAARLLASIGDSAGRVQMMGNAGAALFERGRLDSAALLLERTRRRALLLGDRRTAGNAATVLGSIALERHEPRSALEFQEQARALHEGAGDFRGAAADLGNAGQIAEELGDTDAAERHYRAALAITEQRLAGERSADHLLNLGILELRRGRSAVARGLVGRAVDRYRAAGESRNEALALMHLGAADASGPAPGAARPSFERAARLFAASGDAAGEADARRLLASVLAAAGDLDEALEQIGLASRLVDRLDPPDPAASAAVALVRADLELLLNRGAEARSWYELSRRRARAAGHDAWVADAAQGLALVEQKRGRHDAAIAILEPLLRTQPAGRSRAWTELLLGTSRFAIGDTLQAAPLLDRAAQWYAAARDGIGAALAHGQRADLAIAQGRPFEALSLLTAARRAAPDAAPLDWWLLLLAGRAREAAGDATAALALYDSAAASVERLGSRIRLSDRRALVLDDKWAVYAAAASLAARRGDLERAFGASERLRARQLLDLLAREPARRGEPVLRGRERALRRRIQTLTASAASDDEGRRGTTAAVAADTREALLAAQTAYRHVMDSLAQLDPGATDVLRGEPAPLAQVRAALGQGELLLEYLVTGDELRVFAVTADSLYQLAVPASRERLRIRVDFARWAMQERAADSALWRGALRELDRLLVEPLRASGLLAAHPRLIIVPHLELHYLPFEALIADGRYLVETHEITYAPSASTWLLGRAAAPGRGVLALAPLEDALPGTRRELAALRDIWGGEAMTRSGHNAGRRALQGIGGRYRIVHLATRGVLDRRNPLFSHVQLGPSPGDDGRLAVHEVLQMRLDTDLLVLTACETALGSGALADVPNGDDWIGLVRAFLNAGARNVAATLWAVDDRRTATLAASFHRGIAAGAPYAAALAAAKRAAIASPDESSPYYWAGLVLTGSAVSNR